MDWIAVVVYSMGALGVALYLTWQIRRKRAKQPTYDELKRDRDALFFAFIFSGFWILMAASRVDWKFFGEPWTGLCIMICFASAYRLARFFFERMDRPKTSPKEAAHA